MGKEFEPSSDFKTYIPNVTFSCLLGSCSGIEGQTFGDPGMVEKRTEGKREPRKFMFVSILYVLGQA